MNPSSVSMETRVRTPATRQDNTSGGKEQDIILSHTQGHYQKLHGFIDLLKLSTFGN